MLRHYLKAKTYNIFEKVLAKQRIKNKNYILIKYKGWPDKFNEWISPTNTATL